MSEKVTPPKLRDATELLRQLQMEIATGAVTFFSIEEAIRQKHGAAIEYAAQSIFTSDRRALTSPRVRVPEYILEYLFFDPAHEVQSNIIKYHFFELSETFQDHFLSHAEQQLANLDLPGDIMVQQFTPNFLRLPPRTKMLINNINAGIRNAIICSISSKTFRDNSERFDEILAKVLQLPGCSLSRKERFNSEYISTIPYVIPRMSRAYKLPRANAVCWEQYMQNTQAFAKKIPLQQRLMAPNEEIREAALKEVLQMKSPELKEIFGRTNIITGPVQFWVLTHIAAEPSPRLQKMIIQNIGRADVMERIATDWERDNNPLAPLAREYANNLHERKVIARRRRQKHGSGK